MKDDQLQTAVPARRQPPLPPPPMSPLKSALKKPTPALGTNSSFGMQGDSTTYIEFKITKIYYEKSK
jgi:hypothetical protein